MAEKTCEHIGCGCTVDDSYCSDHCREHGDHSSGDFGEHDCGCGHDECRSALAGSTEA